MKLLREPLIQFLLIGAALFGIEYARGGMRSASEIVVTRGRLEQLAGQFRAVQAREPTRSELENLVNDYVREEVFYREAVALGLDQDDPVIRQHLMSKVQLASEEPGADSVPPDSVLSAWIAAHPSSLRLEPVLSFTQRLLGSDHSTLARDFTAMERRDVALKFGDSFAAVLDTVPLGKWVGPVQSTYGMHEVLVRSRSPGRVPSLDEVRDQVLRAIRLERHARMAEESWLRLRQKYEVRVEWP
jgi:hypothetical protein